MGEIKRFLLIIVKFVLVCSIVIGVLGTSFVNANADPTSDTRTGLGAAAFQDIKPEEVGGVALVERGDSGASPLPGSETIMMHHRVPDEPAVFPETGDKKINDSVLSQEVKFPSRGGVNELPPVNNKDSNNSADRRGKQPEATDLWTVVFEDDFEGQFPGSNWDVYDGNGTLGGEVFWDDDMHKAYSGSWWGWAANGGADGQDPETNPYYPKNMDAWMVYGPFDLSDAVDAYFSFDYWNDSEMTHDWFKWLWSPDNALWNGTGNSGVSTGWHYVQYDLSEAIGEPSVWIAFQFTSDDNENSGYGAYVDNVLIQKELGPNLTPYTPDGWEYPLVPSSIEGTNIVNTLLACQDTKIDWAEMNDGYAEVDGEFLTELHFDGAYEASTLHGFWEIGGWFIQEDYTLDASKTPNGLHTLAIMTDYNNDVKETNEGDNIWSMDFYWEECPTADFSGSPTSGAAPLTVDFTNESTGYYDTCFWDFGDGNVSTSCDEYISHTYNNPRSYTVSLEVSITDNPEVEDTETKLDYISVYEPQLPNLTPHTPDGWDYPIVPSYAPGTNTVATLLACVNTYIDWSVINDGNAEAYDFSSSVWLDDILVDSDLTFSLDGGDSTEFEDTVLDPYPSIGSHTLSIIVDEFNAVPESNEDDNTWSMDFYWEECPVADFSGIPTSGAAPLTVDFTNESTGYFDTCYWDFGDGNDSTSCDEYISHTYNDPGQYPVSLEVGESETGYTDDMEWNYITVYEPVAADFSGIPTSGAAPLYVEFTDQSTGDYDTCTWNFGDGSYDYSCGDPSHTYTSDGDYTVSLELSGDGGSDTRTRTGYINVSAGVHADFSGTPRDGVAPLEVYFTNQSSGDYDTCTWSFGDGGSSSSCGDPSHTYNDMNTYSVSLTVSGPGGEETEAKTNYIVVHDTVEANFSGTPTSGIGTLAVTFTNWSSGSYDTCLWEFGDGDTDSSCGDPSHTYTSPGSYTVSLTVSGPGGTDTDTKADYITVYEPVTADFSGAPTGGAAPLEVYFTDMSSGDYDTCDWNFGDGNHAYSCGDQSHTYTSDGTYTVSLEASGDGGTDTRTRTGYINVSAGVHTDFISTPRSGIGSLVVSFTNWSSGSYDTCLWTFGDGDTDSTCGDPSHTYTSPGTYTVSLSVSGPGGSDTETKTDYITVYMPAPTSVAATDGAFTDRVRIAWNIVADANRYELYRATSEGGVKEVIDGDAVSPYDDFGVEVETIYYYWVVACNATGCSDYSEYDTGWSAGSAPAVPQNVSATDGESTDWTQISWNPSDGAESYDVYFATAPGAAKTLLGDIPNSPIEHTDGTAGRDYYYWVQACNGFGCSDFSSYDSGWRAVPPPTGVDATDGTLTDRVSIDWENVTDADRYELYRATGEFGTKTLLSDDALKPFSDFGAEVDTTYFYWLVACNQYRCSDYSAYDTGWRAGTCDIPAEPTLLSPPDNVGTSDNTPTFDWEPSNNSDEYHLQVDSRWEFTDLVIDTLTPGTDFTPGSALDDSMYYWRVRGHNTGGGCDVYGEWSERFHFIISTAAPFDIQSNWAASVPTINGQISPGEWSDAATYDITIPEPGESVGENDPRRSLPDSHRWNLNWPIDKLSVPASTQWTNITLYVKNDNDYLYLAIDNPNDTEPDYLDIMGVYFDDNPLPSDGVWTNPACGNPDGEGTIFIYDTSAAYREITAGPTYCDNVDPAPGTDGEHGISSGNLQKEIAIDLSISALRASSGSTINMLIMIINYMGDENYIYQGKWPLVSNFQDPATYGSLTLAGGNAPAVPTGVAATDGTYTNRVRVSWDSVPGATYYEVYRALSQGGAKSLLGSPSASPYNDSSAAENIVYHYWVKACSTYGCSGFSSYTTGYIGQVNLHIYLPLLLK